MASEKVITVERRLKLTPRACAVCGRPFDGWGQQRYDNEECRRRADYERHAESRRQKRRARYARQKREGGQ